MATHVDVDSIDDQVPPTPAPAGTPERPRRGRRRALIAVGVVLALLVAAVGWFFLARDRATVVGGDAALDEFRSAGGGAGGDADGRPAAGVYAATATGDESIGLPGFDEELGPEAPVTVTYADGRCFTYRADFNSHHWRSWSFCPTATATFAITELQSWTARKAAALDIETLSTYTCDQPLDVLWDGATRGDRRTSSCTGTNDVDDTVTGDAGVAEFLGTDTVDVDGTEVDAVRVRTSDTFSEAQSGTEVAEWWLDAATGLPLRVDLESSLTGGPSSYAEQFDLALGTTSPAT